MPLGKYFAHSEKRSLISSDASDTTPEKVTASEKRSVVSDGAVTPELKKQRFDENVQQQNLAPIPQSQGPPPQMVTGTSSLYPAAITEMFEYYESLRGTYDFPSWLRPGELRDGGGRLPQDANYDQSTLLVPSEQEQKTAGHGTPMLHQFWAVKAKHFDKVVAFKVGGFYEIMYYDAAISQRVCELNWQGGHKMPRVGFPERSLHFHASRLVEAGYKVVVVEQVETPEEASKRAGSAATVQRKACEVFSSGTLVHTEMIKQAEARYLMYLAQGKDHEAGDFAACLVDCAASQVIFSHFTDSNDLNSLRTLIAQVQPREIVFDAKNVGVDVMRLLRSLQNRPQLSPLYAAPNKLAATREIEAYEASFPGRLPAELRDQLTKECAAQAVAGLVCYLKEVLQEWVLPLAKWEMTKGAVFVSGAGVTPRLFLDAAALSQLEVLETAEGRQGSLLEHMDQTVTPFGARLLRRWVCAPLRDPRDINMRLDCVEYLMSNQDVSKKVREGLKSLPDIERMLTRIWTLGKQTEREAVLLQDVASKRLKDFMEVIRAFERCIDIVTTFDRTSVPSRLKALVTEQEDGGLFPNVRDLINNFKGRLLITGDVYRPQPGVDHTEDKINEKLGDLRTSMATLLSELKAQHPKVPLQYVMLKTEQQGSLCYQVEAPEGTMPQKFLGTVDITSSRKGFIRFQTKAMKQVIAEMIEYEQQQKDNFFPFMSKLFNEFYRHQLSFSAVVSPMAELDALVALSIVAQQSQGKMCRPEFVESSPEEVGQIELRGCRHPVHDLRMGKSFVPNDVVLGQKEDPHSESCVESCVLLITGPNMGGKSTSLRQTCLAIMMAQIGSYVVADKCRLTPVDRIFTRIGAQDSLIEGKSTFLTELEETSAILTHATRHSFAVIDELGRGTSTFDGAAIAWAALDSIAHRIKCPSMFATHYHALFEATISKAILSFHMAAKVNDETKELTFLYKLEPGLAPSSHGHNVARLAGLPESTMRIAEEESMNFAKRTKGTATLAAFEVHDLAKKGDESGLRALFRRHKESMAP